MGAIGAGVGGLGLVGTAPVGGVRGAGGAVGPVPPCGGAFRVTRTVSLRIGTAEVFVIGFGSSFSLINYIGR